MIISKINHIIIDGKNGIEAWNPYGFLDFLLFLIIKYLTRFSIK